MSADLDFQKTAFVAVRAEVDVSVSVETQPDDNQALPYVFLGESQLNDHEIGHEINLTVHVYAKGPGTDTAKALQGNVRDVLHGGDFTSGVFRYTCCREEYCTLILDPEDAVWHGVQRFRVLASAL